jgi:hypothetical protein
MDEEGFARCRPAGGEAWYLGAEELEPESEDVLVAERAGDVSSTSCGP